MQIICISCGSQSRGEEFAQKLAAKLGYECLNREFLLEEATRLKIPVGKLETAVIKPHIFSENLALELEHYKALSTYLLCQKALETNIVYYGRTGHLLFPGIDNICKIRVVADLEYRIQYVMRKLDLSRAKAKKYVERVEDDRRRWVRQFYGMDWDVFTLYDMVFNLSYVSADNAAAAACAITQLPEFQATPASINALKNLYLISGARLELFKDPRTRNLNAKISLSNGKLYVVYPYQQAKQASFIQEVLQGLKGINEIIATEAQTHILWIQEAFDSPQASQKQVFSLAKTWDAAIELVKYIPDEEPVMQSQTAQSVEDTSDSWRDTGIIDDKDDTRTDDYEDVSMLYEKLINEGRAAGRYVVRGGQKSLLQAIDHSIKYRLIILDNTFLSKGDAARIRLRQELSNTLTDALKVPVVDMKEIDARYHFGGKQAVRMILFGLLAALIAFLILNFDTQILSILSREGLRWRILAATLIFLFVPTFAYVYSTFAGLFLKMIKLD